MTPARSTVLASAIAGLLLNAQATRAADLAYELSAGVGHSDNITAAETNEVDEDIAMAGLRFSLGERTARLIADVVSDLRYFEYLDDTFDSELVGSLAGNARFGIVPERFEWVVSDNYGQALRDPFQAATPENRDDINVFATGPDVWLNFGSQSRLRVGGRYTLVSYEDLPFDSDSKAGEAEFLRMLSDVSSVSLNARVQQVEYDEEALQADYDQNDYFLRYDVTGARTQLAVDLGYTEIEREVASEKEDGMLWRLNVVRRMSGSSTGTVAFGREFTNAASAFAAGQGFEGVGLSASSGVQNARPFTRDFANLRWGFARNRTALSLGGTYEERKFEDDPTQPLGALDQELTSFFANVERTMSPRTSLGLSGGYQKSEFEIPGTDYDEVDAGVNFRWRWSETTSLDATYRYVDRSSDIAGGSYTENRFLISLVYGRNAPRRTFAGPEFAVDRER